MWNMGIRSRRPHTANRLAMELTMSTSNIVLIVIAALVVIAVIVALVVVSTRAKRRRQIQQAEEIREQARVESARVERREALAEETAARARAAQAEAEAKAAEAKRLQDRAAEHQSEVAASREQLDEQWKRADTIDPNTRLENAEQSQARDEVVTREGAYGDTDHYRGART